MIGILQKVDRQSSEMIHALDNKVFSKILSPFATLFNPSKIYLPIGIIFGFNYVLLKRAFDYSLVSTLFFVLCYFINQMVIMGIQMLLARQRPDYVSCYKHKSDTFRTATLTSLPCADSAQAVNLALNLLFAFRQVNFVMKFLLGIKMEAGALEAILISFVVIVMISRIYFLCQYTFDTILGGMIGFFLTNVLLQSFFKEFSRSAFHILDKIDL